MLNGGAVRSQTPHRPAVTRRPFEQPRSRPRPLENRSARPHLINEDLFKAAAIRERKRADRANRPCVLLHVAFHDALARSPSIWALALEAIAAATRETDVVGWCKRGVAVGVIMPEMQVSSAAAARAIEHRVASELARRVDPETAAGFSIRAHVHAESKPAGEEGLRPLEALPPEFRRRGARRTIHDASKRALDVMASLTLIVALSPLLLLIAALVKFRSRGPIFFRQVRVGQMMKPFTMLKFRTMRVDADHALHQEFVTNLIKSAGASDGSANNGLFKMTNDPRVTPVGQVLRRTSLDELPQLWNVLRGEMSLVGPRPPLHYEVQQYQSWHRRRVMEAKPGLTGLWQVAGRSRTTFDEMVRLDLRYARTRSFWTDLKILLATPLAVISGKGAC
jgi:lipopolysaccharide/colanic/teichoic acid biosynthesis glycosyltransferase